MAEKNLSRLPASNKRRIETLAATAGAKLHECYQCGKCAAGCPMAETMDLKPRQVIRHLQLGLLDEALHSKGPWICATCYTCSARCPHDVPIAQLMEAVRQQAEFAGIRPIKRSYVSTNYFMLPVKWFGRSSEFLYTAFYNVLSGRLLQHFNYLPSMLKAGKLKFFPAMIRNRMAVRKIINNCEREATKI